MEGTDKFRLPTEAEWEYACKAKTTIQFLTGNCISSDQANYDARSSGMDCPEGSLRGGPVKVKSFQANVWGLYDMHGNVWEWCQDWYGEYPTGPITDPKGLDNGKSRVFRGGSWDLKVRYLRSAHRGRYLPGFRNDDFGFRVARDF